MRRAFLVLALLVGCDSAPPPGPGEGDGGAVDTIPGVESGAADAMGGACTGELTCVADIPNATVYTRDESVCLSLDGVTPKVNKCGRPCHQCYDEGQFGSYVHTTKCRLSWYDGTNTLRTVSCVRNCNECETW